MVLIVIGTCLCLMPASYAQTCMQPANPCDQWWDINASRGIQNPSCAFINHAFLLSDQAAPNPSDGFPSNPAGQRCGIESHGVPCGVRTTTDTCAEAIGPIFCDPFSDPGCCGDPYDPFCGLGGGDGGGGHQCLHRCPPAVGVVPESRGSAGVESTLRKAVLVSPLPKSVSTLLQELAKVDSIHLKAQFTLSVDGKKTTASYEYWERGSRYRIRLDPPADYPWSDIAFNGTFLQARVDSDTVEIRRGDDRSTPLPDGPLALALASLRVNDPTECLMCQLRLADLKKAVQWRREAPAELKASEAALGAGAFDAGALRTGEFDAEGRLVRFVWPVGETGNDGGFEVTLSDYRPILGTGAMFPMRLIARLKPNAFVEYAVEKIDLSPSFEGDVFDIYSTSPKVFFGVQDAAGSWTGRFVRYTRTPGLSTSCDTKPKDTTKP